MEDRHMTNDKAIKDDFIIDDFIENFKVLASVPRPSKHEKQVSQRLKEWFEEAGFKVRRNPAYDLFVDVPATPGYEELPLTILQSHIDMVCVAADGNSTYDPIKDPIKVIIDREPDTVRSCVSSEVTVSAPYGFGLEKHACLEEKYLPVMSFY